MQSKWEMNRRDEVVLRIEYIQRWSGGYDMHRLWVGKMRLSYVCGSGFKASFPKSFLLYILHVLIILSTLWYCLYWNPSQINSFLWIPWLFSFSKFWKAKHLITLNFYFDPFFPILKILKIPVLQINSKFRPSLKHVLLSDS